MSLQKKSANSVKLSVVKESSFKIIWNMQKINKYSTIHNIIMQLWF